MYTHMHTAYVHGAVSTSPSVKSKKLDPASMHVVYIHVYVRTRRQHAFAWCSTPAWTTALHTTRLEHSLKEGTQLQARTTVDDDATTWTRE